MIQNNSPRHRQTLRFLKWIRRYPGWWFVICTPGTGHLTLSMMQNLLRRLAGEGFYEIVFVLLMVHRDAPFMENFSGFLSLDLLAEKWARGGQEEIIERLIRYFD